ncbi:Chalcone-flavanone isomerase [Seminavis robusta]|uniref:Chalcone-flavanone isomerase n=1 Tax=Seminavis robusta TaxID=568900 RepID=A0A9N8ET06_9STRA|nr:Chalcone-flavanone isomerase [Seminavis robusta]|eukprot:Sro1861_g302190.1 Chalcone-flavanone isomerase (260) ;mRNA; f:12640-13528
MMSSKLIVRRGASLMARNHQPKATTTTTTRAMSSAVRTTTSRQLPLVLAGATAASTVLAFTCFQQQNHQKTFCNAGLPVISVGESVKEPDTGILFPPMVNGFTFLGCGVRIKYVFVKVYAVGAYFRPENFLGMPKDDKAIETALLDPNNHRTIRIVMNRSMTMDKYNDAIVESLKPRMNGQDLETLDEFKKLNPSGNLEKGSELIMTIRGDTLLYKNAMGNVGTIQSAAFTKAMCDVYFGSSPVSPPAKQAVMDAIKKL